MLTQTPQFNKALDEISKNLKPHQRKCGNCGSDFQIYKEDIEFYQMLRVPPPTLCPLCRKIRRFAHTMRMPVFYKRPCQAPGHTEKVITVYPPSTPHIIYDFSYWHSDKWDPAAYGREYKSSRPFFTQFRELFFAVPHVPLDRDPGNVNSDYSVGGFAAKNAYWCGSPYYAEDVSYCWGPVHTRDSLECVYSTSAEQCFGAVSSDKTYKCIFTVDCMECRDSAFLYDCKNCHNCFFSSNLRNKSYVFENAQLSKEEYKKKLADINLGDRRVLQEQARAFRDLIKKSIHRATFNVNAVNSVGDLLRDCKNCFFAFAIWGGSEDIRYADYVDGGKDLMDVSNTARPERTYECAVTLNSNSRFSMYVRGSSSLEYSSECYNCHNCFGCVGLKNKEFHIFNQPYREDDYWVKVDEIKTKMLWDGEYGEFFPLSLGLFPYQSSNAQMFFPLTEKEAQEKGIPWYEEPVSDIPQNTKLRRAPQEVPEDIKDVKDEILQEAIVCEETGKPFRIIPQELAFYRKMNLPLPTKHPWQRMKERISFLHPLWLYPFICPKCGKESYTVYPPEQQKKLRIFCESCYLKEIG